MAVPYYGNFAEDATVFVVLNSFSSNDPSASVTITNFINTDVHIHKDNGLTQRNNAAGITVSVDFDGITGGHQIVIDTSDDTVGGFWVTGADYFVRIEGVTIDGATINSFVAHFSIENRFNEVNVTKILGHLLTQSGTQLADGFEKFFDVGTPTGTVNSLPGVAPDAAGGLPISDAGGLDLDTQLANTHEVTAARMGALTDWINAGRLDAILDIIAADVVNLDGDAMRGTDSANTTVPDVAGTAATPAEVATALTDINLDHFMKTATGGADMTTEVVDNTVLSRMLADGDTSEFVPSTHGLEPIRVRGDTAWITGGGGGITDILNIQVLVPNGIDLANTATVRIGLGLTNMLDDLPTTVEITPGTLSIDRKAIGGTSWTSVVSDAACSELAGLVYYDEVFDSGTGYAAGDSIRFTFKSQKITAGANDYEITGTDGWICQTFIREAMRGTDSANTTVPDVAGTAASLHSTTDGKVDAVQSDVTTIAADVVNIDGSAMRGTDSANTTVPDTAGTAASLHSTTDGKIDTVQSGVTTIAADVVNIDGAAMRGTNSANTVVPDAAGVAPTSSEIATAVTGATIDTGITVAEALEAVLALKGGKKVTKTGNTYRFYNQANAIVATMTVGAAETTTVIS